MTMTTSEAAAELGIGESGVRMLVRRGQLAPVRPGAKPLRFADAEVWRLQQLRARADERARVEAAYDTALAPQVSGV